MTKYFHFYLLTIAILLQACQGANSENETDAAPEGIITHFQYFPEKQFETLYLLQETDRAEECLEKLNYVEISEQTKHYKNEEEKIEVLLSGSAKISSIRVFFLDKEDVMEKEKLLDMIETASVKATRSPDFSYFEYDAKTASFSVSVFAQKDMLRLNIELIKPH